MYNVGANNLRQTGNWSVSSLLWSHKLQLLGLLRWFTAFRGLLKHSFLSRN